MKRFYKKVSVSEQGNMYTVLLDGKAIKTPEKSLFVMPTKKMAEAAAKEWGAQEQDIDPISMPITKLINTAIDRVDRRREDIIDELVNYVGSDQLCYRAEEPIELIELQNELWNPLLSRMKENHDISLKLTTGITFIQQDPMALNKIRVLLQKIESYKLTAFYSMITINGSVSIGFNLFEGHIDVEHAWDAGQLDENFQTSQWGVDDEAEIRRDNLKSELKNAAYFLTLCNI